VTWAGVPGLGGSGSGEGVTWAGAPRLGRSDPSGGVTWAGVTWAAVDVVAAALDEA
jgi:hypothetical protein